MLSAKSGFEEAGRLCQFLLTVDVSRHDRLTEYTEIHVRRRVGRARLPLGEGRLLADEDLCLRVDEVRTVETLICWTDEGGKLILDVERVVGQVVDVGDGV